LQEVCGAHGIILGFPDEGMDRSTSGGVRMTPRIHLEVGREKRFGKGTVILTKCGRRWTTWRKISRNTSEDPDKVTCLSCRRILYGPPEEGCC